MSIISQLKYVFQNELGMSHHRFSFLTCRIGMDLSKVTFPTFVLEPRSMLERITDFMSHPELVFGYVELRFVRSEHSLMVTT